MNRGINEQKDLPRMYLEDIYDQIATNEIKMNASGMQKATRQTLGNTVVGSRLRIDHETVSFSSSE